MSEETKKLEVLWTVPQVAKYLGMSPITVYRWLAEGKTFNPDEVIRFANRVRITRSGVERIAGTVRKELNI
jgi:excisionase family DNA binding protein